MTCWCVHSATARAMHLFTKYIWCLNEYARKINPINRVSTKSQLLRNSMSSNKVTVKWPIKSIQFSLPECSIFSNLISHWCWTTMIQQNEIAHILEIHYQVLHLHETGCRQYLTHIAAIWKSQIKKHQVGSPHLKDHNKQEKIDSLRFQKWKHQLNTLKSFQYDLRLKSSNSDTTWLNCSAFKSPVLQVYESASNQ